MQPFTELISEFKTGEVYEIIMTDKNQNFLKKESAGIISEENNIRFLINVIIENVKIND